MEPLTLVKTIVSNIFSNVVTALGNMTILGCPCLNVLIHIEKLEDQDEEGLTRVQLTLDGINVQQHFLVDEIKTGDWTVVKCKVGSDLK